MSREWPGIFRKWYDQLTRTGVPRHSFLAVDNGALDVVQPTVVAVEIFWGGGGRDKSMWFEGNGRCKITGELFC